MNPAHCANFNKQIGEYVQISVKYEINKMYTLVKKKKKLFSIVNNRTLNIHCQCIHIHSTYVYIHYMSYMKRTVSIVY